MADRILGMGDVVSLVERAQDVYDEKKAREISKKIAKNKFGFDDFLSQINQVKKMGNLKDTISMIPGASAIKDVDLDNDSFKHIEALIHSMTPKERSEPKIIDHSRKKRFSRGAGRDIQEINALLKQFEQMSKMMKGGAMIAMMMMPPGGMGGPPPPKKTKNAGFFRRIYEDEFQWSLVKSVSVFLLGVMVAREMKGVDLMAGGPP